MSTGSDRQKRLARRRAAAGMKSVVTHLFEVRIEFLKLLYPGPGKGTRKGIDWNRAINMALDPYKRWPGRSCPPGRLIKPEPRTRCKSGAERQKKLNAARAAAGMRPVKVWLSNTQEELLKLRYPGPRGGIDWISVSEMASNPSPNMSDVAYFHQDWVTDPRCQARVDDGSRCQSASKNIFMIKDDRYIVGEFICCDLHCPNPLIHVEFWPHPSVLKAHREDINRMRSLPRYVPPKS